MHLFETLEAGLRQIDAQGLRRRRRSADSGCAAHQQIDGRPLVAFASNDYLGLASHPLLAAALAEGAARYGAGSGGSHLLGGHSRAHALLEDQLAEFSGGFVDNARALYFSTGYMANLATLGALAALGAVNPGGNVSTGGAGNGATIFSDALNHASLIDGARLARADVRVYPHADAATLATMLEDCASPVKLIVTDSVFSMDGDLAPLAALLALAERHGAWLVVDDAHGFGVLGEHGAGALEHLQLRSPQLVYVGTLGKAAGVAGAFVIAHPELVEWLVQRARAYIFTTAAPPAVAHAVSASLRLIGGEEGAARRAHLQTLIARVRRLLLDTRWQPVDSSTAVQPLIIGGNQATLDVAAALDAAGLWVPAIRPPTVPQGTSRLRISLSAGHSHDDLDRLANALLACSAAESGHQTGQQSGLQTGLPVGSLMCVVVTGGTGASA
jgi:8-amino-7-oxononanoate synthase